MDVRVVPELAPFVQTNPTSFENIVAGQELNLDIIITIPEGTPPQTIDGTIQLRNAGRPPRTFARPLPVNIDIQEGQRFVDPNGNYTVIIPTELFIEFFDDENLLELRESENVFTATESPRITVTVDQNPNQLTLEEYYDGDPGVNLMGHSGGDFSHISVAGETAFKFDPFVTLSGNIIVVIPRESKFIIVNDDGKSFQENGIFQKILDSLKF